MDAKERHELKDNDLAEFLENFGAFWQKRGDMISTVFFVCVVAWVLWYGIPALGWHGVQQYRKGSTQSQERVWSDLWVVSTPPGYRELARETEGYAGVPDLALLRGAEAYHKQAIDQGREEADPDSGLMSAKESLDNAAAMYKRLLDDSKADAVYRANAAVGLANVSETRGDFEAAKTYWARAKELADEARMGSVSKQAEIRLSLLDDLAKPIVLGEDEPVAEAVGEAVNEEDEVTDVTPAQAPDHAAGEAGGSGGGSGVEGGAESATGAPADAGS